MPEKASNTPEWDGSNPEELVRAFNYMRSLPAPEEMNICRYCKEQYDPDIGPDFCSFVCDVASTVEASVVSFLRFEFEKQKAEAVAADTINLTDWEDAADALERGDHRR